MALGIKIAAPPVDGAANKELILYLSRLFNIPKTSIAVHSGKTARIKIVHINGEAGTIADRVGLICPNTAVSSPIAAVGTDTYP